MEQLIELLKQIQDLAGVAIDALNDAGGGEKEKKPEGEKPPGEKPPGEGGPPPEGGEGAPKPPEGEEEPAGRRRY